MIGFPIFVIPTLIIKGIEGSLAGVVSNQKQIIRDILAVVLAGCAMVLGYFLVEAYILQWGLAGALAEVPGNVAQITIGGLVGIPLANILRRRLPEFLTLSDNSRDQ